MASFLRLFIPWLVGAALLAALGGCANKRESERRRSEVERAASLIDQGQYSEAIYVLSEKLKAEPAHQRARLLLASAYASRAGLRFLDFKHFASQVQSWSSADEPQLFNSRNRVLQSVVKTIFQIQRFSQAFDTVPAPSSATGFEDLRRALDVLDGAGQLHDGAALYRALIRVVVFKNDINERYGLVPVGGCGIDIPRLMKWFGEVGSELELMMTDYAYSQKDAAARERSLKSVLAVRKTVSDGQAMLAGVRGGQALNTIQQGLLQGSSCGQ